MYKFPQTVYDQPRNLLSALGSFWSSIYDRRDQVLSYAAGKCSVESQAMLDVLELIASMSRYTVPIFHTDQWYELRLRESQRNDAATSLLRYDGATNFGEGHAYDVPVDSGFHSFPLPSRLSEAPVIVNRFAAPSLTWLSGIDYLVDVERQALVFHANPFTDNRVIKQPVYEDGLIVDREALLWIFRGQYDLSHVYEQFAYAINLRMKSSKGYRDLMNAVFDAIVGGTAVRQIETAFSALTGIPLAQEPTETVKFIHRDNNSRLVITDQHTYKFDLEALPIVEVGDEVRAGQPLVDALRFYEFNRGQVDATLQGLAMGRGFLANCYYGDLIFENKDVPLEVITDDPSGYTKLKFPLGGFPADVERFFEALHANGVSAASEPVDPCETADAIRTPGDDCDTETTYGRRGTLAHLLDTRTNRVGEPRASNLPRNINPLQFLMGNILRGGIFLVRIKASHLSNGLGLHHARLLQKVVPPHTALLVLVELTAQTDSVTTNRITEAISTFAAMEPLRDELVTSRVREGKIAVRLVSGTCQ